MQKSGCLIFNRDKYYPIPSMEECQAFISKKGKVIFTHPKDPQRLAEGMKVFISKKRPGVQKWGVRVSILKAMMEVFYPEEMGTRKALYPKDGDFRDLHLDNLELRECPTASRHVGILCTTTGKTYKTATECCRVMKLCPTAVGRVANGERLSHKGHRFKWID